MTRYIVTAKYEVVASSKQSAIAKVYNRIRFSTGGDVIGKDIIDCKKRRD